MKSNEFEISVFIRRGRNGKLVEKVLIAFTPCHLNYVMRMDELLKLKIPNVTLICFAHDTVAIVRGRDWHRLSADGTGFIKNTRISNM